MQEDRAVPGEDDGGGDPGRGVGSQDGWRDYGKAHIQCKVNIKKQISALYL